MSAIRQFMSGPDCSIGWSTGASADVLIPVIRAAATIGFAVVPCSLGFVLIAVSEQLIRAIMVGEDPELLVGNLQQQFPHAALRVEENHDPAGSPPWLTWSIAARAPMPTAERDVSLQRAETSAV